MNNSWQSKNPLQPPKSASKKSQPPRLLYPIFADCASLTDDPYWKKIFQDASYAKFPKGFTVRDNYLIYRQGKKINNVAMNGTPFELVDEVIRFMKIHSGRKSGQDTDAEKRANQLSQEQQRSLADCQWVDLTKKAQKQLIDLYITAKTRNKSPEQVLSYTRTVKLGFLFGILNNSNIHFERGRVQDISGIKEADGQYSWTSPFYPPHSDKGAALELMRKINYRQGFSLNDAWINLFKKPVQSRSVGSRSRSIETREDFSTESMALSSDLK